VSFGLLNKLPPFFSVLHLSSPSFHHVHPPTISAPSLMSISVQSIYPRLIVWFLNNSVFTV
jgi:hypothetical protein